VILILFMMRSCSYMQINNCSWPTYMTAYSINIDIMIAFFSFESLIYPFIKGLKGLKMCLTLKKFV
jgi:hypothetical protein